MEIKPAMVAIAAFVVITVIAAVLMPVLGDATKTEDTYTNEGFYRMSEFASTDTYSASWDHTDPNVITVNGNKIGLPKVATTYSYTILGNSDFFVRYVVGASETTIVMQVYSSGATYEAKTANSTDMAINLSSGTLTFDNGSGTTKTISVSTSFYSVAKDGDYTLKNATDTAFVLGDSEIVGIGRTDINVSGSNKICRVFVKGSIDDGFTGSMVSMDNVTATVGTITATYTDDSKHDDLYSFSKLTFTATLSGTSADVTYSQVLVPYEVTAERSVHFDANENAILLAVPALLIVALLVGVLALAFRGRE